MITIVGVGNFLKATAVFSLFAVPPGYVAAWLSGLFEFRRASLLRQVAIAIPLSIATLPIVLYLPWRFLSIRAVWVVMFCVWAAFLMMAGARLRVALSGQRPVWRPACTVGLVAAAVWIAIALLWLPDMAVGNRLYYPVQTFDYLSRVPMVNQLSHQTKLPPQSPFLNPGRYIPLRYHYFWPMVCGLVQAAGRGTYSARETAAAGTIWAGIALLCMVALFLRFFEEIDPSRWRIYAIALALLGVTGLDIIPVLVWDYQLNDQPELWLPTVEWWNDQVTGWLDAMIWVPHHVAALAATLLAFLILWHGTRARLRAGHVVLAGLCLASAAGMSIYVTFVMAVILVVWALVMAVQREFQPLIVVAAAGTLSLLLVAPFLMELQSARSEGGVILWNVREFWFMRYELSRLELMGPLTSLKAVVWRLVFLPFNYLLELGAFFYAGMIFCRRLAKTRPVSNRDRAALVMLVTAVLIATFLKSSVSGAGNDLGWRSFMPAQFILLLWAAGLFADWKASFRPIQAYGMIFLLFLGALTTLFDLALLRFYPVFVDVKVFNSHLGARNRALAESYAWIRANTAETTVVQSNPDRLPHHYGLYADRPALAIGGECASYSGETEACSSIKGDLRALFNGIGTTETFSSICRNYPVDLIIMEVYDPSWKIQHGWVWTERPVFSNGLSRVFACHPLLR